MKTFPNVTQFNIRKFILFNLDHIMTNRVACQEKETNLLMTTILQHMLSTPITGSIEAQKGHIELKIAIKVGSIFLLSDLHNSYHFSAKENN